MRRFAVLVVGVGALLGSAGAIMTAWSAGLSGPRLVQDAPAAPWQPGSCYRVFRIGNDPPDIFKVVASPEGNWIRVEADPRAPWVPGARPSARVWLNSNAVFVVQEWSCSLLP